ncbi:MAG: hypothetical protein M1840_002107 [Geoglossum simile]|nr:MAG: hypothetical protein M1840_002107 [Geoglossum simile]
MAAPYSSPKRKRDAEAPTSQAPLNTNVTFPLTFAGVLVHDGSSPLTVAAGGLEQPKPGGKGRGSADLRLAIRNGREVGAPKPTDDMLDIGGKARKRVKKRSAAAETKKDDVSMTLRLKDSKTLARRDTTDGSSMSLSSDSCGNGINTEDTTFGSPSMTSPLVSRAKARLMSPPLSDNMSGDKEPEETPRIGDSGDEDEDLRSRLTWRDDEITGVDFDDPDDDGEGVNGIGYKPTPAQAQARIEKRKQQIVEYRSREANEARKRRIERRGREAKLVTEVGVTRTTRKVRFADSQGG